LTDICGLGVMDKADKKARLRAWREEERDKARALLPLPDEGMKALFDMLDEELPKAGCDHTRRLTEHWLRTQGHTVESVIVWLEENGGFCDCEALANAEQAWQSAR
jgi:hypothetical protein